MFFYCFFHCSKHIQIPPFAWMNYLTSNCPRNPRNWGICYRFCGRVPAAGTGKKSEFPEEPTWKQNVWLLGSCDGLWRLFNHVESIWKFFKYCQASSQKIVIPLPIHKLFLLNGLMKLSMLECGPHNSGLSAPFPSYCWTSWSFSSLRLTILNLRRRCETITTEQCAKI